LRGSERDDFERAVAAPIEQRDRTVLNTARDDVGVRVAIEVRDLDVVTGARRQRCERRSTEVTCAVVQPNVVFLALRYGAEHVEIAVLVEVGEDDSHHTIGARTSQWGHDRLRERAVTETQHDGDAAVRAAAVREERGDEVGDVVAVHVAGRNRRERDLVVRGTAGKVGSIGGGVLRDCERDRR
jgi:hypothetical protein